MKAEEKKGPLPVWWPKFTKGIVIALIVSFVIGFLGLMLFGLIRFFVIALAMVIIWGMSKSPMAVKIIFTVIVAVFGLGTAPTEIYSKSLWKYPFQKALISCYQNIREPDWFPDFYDDVKGEYEFDYIPSIMQGTGHYSVFFETDEQTRKSYEESFAQKAKFTFTIEEYQTGKIYDGHIPELDKEKEQNKNVSLTFYMGSHYSDAAYGKVKGEALDDTVYILSSNLDFNHPDTSAVVIDNDNNTVFLTQLG